MSAKRLVAAVVDASVAIKWLLMEPDSSSALALRRRWQGLGVVPAAPDFLLIELHNVLWRKLQQGHLTPDAPILTYAPTFGLDLNWFPFEPLLPLAWNVAVRCHVSVYDALYAALAQQLQVAFYTADLRLAEQLAPVVTVKTLVAHS